MTAPRLRFPPAPSGWLHVGGARTALYNWLAARGGDGTFVLRIEDTDAERSDDAAMRGMLDSLRWLGLTWDEGPDIGGPHGPYLQSARRPLHDAVVRRLQEAGQAYEAFETAEELEADRQRAQEQGRPPGYSGAHRDLTPEQRAAYRAEGREAVVRVRTPDEGTIAFDDAVRGTVEVGWDQISDFVIARADGSPTYYLANTVDDLAQGITLIARGEDLLNATPRQLLLADWLLDDTGGHSLLDEALAETGLVPRPDVPRPTYAHLPIIVGEDRKKLGKRHGSVAVDEYRDQGYLPEVMCNFLALLGWSYDDRTERFTVPELIERFSLDRVGRNPALFDTDKLRALNGDRIKELGDTELADRLVPFLIAADALPSHPTPAQRALLEGLAPLVRERIQTLAEAPPLIAWAFADEVTLDERSVAKHLKGRAGEVLDRAAAVLSEVEPWQAETILAGLDELCTELGLGRGKVMQPVRVAVTGSQVSPPLPETLALLDRDVVVARVRAARAHVTEPAEGS